MKADVEAFVGFRKFAYKRALGSGEVGSNWLGQRCNKEQSDQRFEFVPTENLYNLSTIECMRLLAVLAFL